MQSWMVCRIFEGDNIDDAVTPRIFIDVSDLGTGLAARNGFENRGRQFTEFYICDRTAARDNRDISGRAFGDRQVRVEQRTVSGDVKGWV